jgi:hypothetical protein
MTDDIRNAAIEAAAYAVHEYALNSTGYCNIPIDVADEIARAAIDAYERAMWRPVSECPPDKFIQYLVTRDDAPPVRAARDGYGGPFRMHYGGVMETTNEPTHFSPVDDAP